MEQLIEKIISDAKAHFGLTQEATNSELHEALLAAKPNEKADVIVDMASEIAGLVKSETEKQVSEFTAKLESDYKSIIETMESKVSELESKLSETKPDNTEDFNTKLEALQASIETLKTDFGTQLNEIKATPKGAAVPGDGIVINKHEAKGVPLPSQGKNFIKL